MKKQGILPVLLLIILCLTGYGISQSDETSYEYQEASENSDASFVIQSASSTENIQIQDIPAYSGSLVITLNDNIPVLSADAVTTSFISLSELDALGRCGTAYACLGADTLPEEERTEIGMIKPSGWHTIKYDIIDGNYLYNRCHLLAFCLTGINADERNLITGTRQLNITGMLPYEEMVVKYIERTGNHVLYRVEPVFRENNLLADGVHIEALSIEDSEISFNVFIYNIQDGISINYATGESTLDTHTTDYSPAALDFSGKQEYVINKNTGKFHLPSCSSVSDIKPKNKKLVTGTYDEIISSGYEPCHRCLGQ